MPGLEPEDLKDIFSHHPPTSAQTQRYEALRAKALELAGMILSFTPASAEQTLAIRHVQQAVMFANAAVAIHES